MSFMKSTYVVATLALLCVAPVFAQGSSFSAQDQAILKKLNQGSMDEVRMGNMAISMGSSSEVKEFGRRMVQDHTKLAQQVQQLAMNGGVDLKSGASTSGASDMHMVSGKTGKDFDQAYIQSMLQDHQKDITELQQYALTTQNVEMKNLAMKALPIFENHIRIAENVAGKMGISASKGLNQPEHPIG